MKIPFTKLRALVMSLSNQVSGAVLRGFTFDGKRRLQTALGYAETLDSFDYRDRYRRGDIAARLVDIFPRATWRSGFTLTDSEDKPGEDATLFETDAAEFMKDHNIVGELLRADTLAALDTYSIVVLGGNLNDGKMDTPLTSLSDGLQFTSVAAAWNAPINTVDKDTNSKRFGQPLTYNVQFQATVNDATTTGGVGRSQVRPNLPSVVESTGGADTGGIGSMTVHWTRIIHVADNLLDNKIHGEPRLRRCWNRLDDLEKIVGGGSEASWRSMVQKLIVDAGAEAQLDPQAEEDFDIEIEEMRHGLRDVLRMTGGGTVKDISPRMVNFSANGKFIVQLIAGAYGIPYRILLGSEQGELASSQDEDNMDDRVDERRTFFATPLVRMLFDRLIELGAIIEPADDVYEVKWPLTEDLNESEKAEVVERLTKANQFNATAEGRLVLTGDEIRDKVYRLPALGDEGQALIVDRSISATPPTVTAAAGEERADDPPDIVEWQVVHEVSDDRSPSFATYVETVWLAAGEFGIKQADLESMLSVVSANESGNVAGAVADSIADELDTILAAGLPDQLLPILVDGGEAALSVSRERDTLFSDLQAFSKDNGSKYGSSYRLSTYQFELSFDNTNPRAIAWADTQSAVLVTQITDQSRAGLRALVVQGLDAGIPPRRLATLIRERVGLRDDQVTALFNFHSRLTSAGAGDIVRFGAQTTTVPVGGVTEPFIDDALDAYADTLLNQRALLIARTETLHAANAGQRELWLQALDTQQLPTNVQREWIVTPDERLRDSHAALAGQRTGVGESFTSVDGGSIEPGQEPNCRCAQGLVRG